jgi:thiamine biosynthesis lipoprotein
MIKQFIILLTAFSLLIIAGCDRQRQVMVDGRTMGTTYHIKMGVGYLRSVSRIETQIKRRLDAVNQQMSIYAATSELSRFNRMDQANRKFQASPALYQVMSASRRIYRLTHGAWDATVKPLVDLWGFGAAPARNQAPTSAQINAARAAIGFDRIELKPPYYLIKRSLPVTADLGSIAKGYGVDQIADLLKNEGIDNFLVEIGGEIYAAGQRPDGAPWRVGINRPVKNSAPDDIYQTIELANQAMATSGDYRNYFESGQKTYSHIIDPRSGYPVDNGVVSVSVIADTCMMADGLATGIMVMGATEGLRMIERLPDTAALIIRVRADGALETRQSSSWPAHG